MSDILAELRAKFLERCRGDVVRLETLLQTGALDSEESQTLAHNLAGAAGTFGFAEISATAGVIDDAFAQGRPPAPDDMNRLITAIRAALG